MKVAFIYAGGRESKWDAAVAGESPSDFFYGAIEMAARDHEVRCIDAPENPRGMMAGIYNRLMGWQTPVRTRGEHLIATGAVIEQVRGADVVVASSTSHANALITWKDLGRVKCPIVGIHCGLVNFPLEGARLRSTIRSLRRQHVVLFADSEYTETISRFDLDGSHVHANPFGVDVRFWTPGESDAPRQFVAVGNDGRRDYTTLLRAAEGIDAPLTIVTARKLPSPLPQNVSHIKGSWHQPALTDVELRDLYRNALGVIIPLEDSLQPSGQSVALQAMACGRPVILARTRGLWTDGDYLDGEHLTLVEPGDAISLRAAMESLMANPKKAARMGDEGRNAVLRHGTMDAFSGRLETLLQQIVSL